MPSDRMVSVDGRTHVRGEEAPYTGLITFDHNIGSDRDEVNYVNGVREGTSTTWDRMGTKMREENYVDGRLEGISTSWHGNGQKTETNYVNGSLVGRTELDADGNRL